MTASATLLASADNVATMLAPVEPKGMVVIATPSGSVEVEAVDPIAVGHKIAIVDFAPGDRVIKYGECIGVVTAPIACGGWVHIHNLRSQRAQPAKAS